MLYLVRETLGLRTSIVMVAGSRVKEMQIKFNSLSVTYVLI